MLLLAGAFAGCAGGATDKYNLTVLEPKPSSRPPGSTLATWSCYSTTSSFTIINEGAADLNIEDIYLTTNDNDASIEWDNSEPVVVEDDARIEVEVGFAPPLYEDFTGTLVVVSDDPGTPNQYIPLTGSGVDGPIPELVAEPGAIDFGLVEIGTTGQQQLLLINEGGGDVTIESATLDGSSAFSVPDLSGTVYEQREAVRGGPPATPAATATWTNDPTNPTLEIFMLGNGGGDFQYPDADINCPTRLTLHCGPLDGRFVEPMSPEGELQYDWSVLSAPPTVDHRVRDPGKYPNLFADLAGSWTIRLMSKTPLASGPTTQSATSTRFHPRTCTSSSSGTPETPARPAPGSGRLRMYQLPGDCNYCNRAGLGGGDPLARQPGQVRPSQHGWPTRRRLRRMGLLFAPTGGGETIAPSGSLNGSMVWGGGTS